MMKKITLLLLAFALGMNLNAQESFSIDYDGLDEADAIANSMNYSRFIWGLNNDQNYTDGGNMTWAMVHYNNLVNTNDLNAIVDYPESGDYTIMLDSVQVYYTFTNTSNTNHSLNLGVYNFSDVPKDSPGFPMVPTANELAPVAGLTALYSGTMDTTDLPSTPGNTLQIATFMVNTAIPAGERFSLFIESVGDTTNEFNLLAGYKEDCADAELARQSVELLNSQCYGNFGGTQIVPQRFLWVADNCDRFYIQNLVVIPFVTVTANSFVAEADMTSNNVFPNAGCENEQIQLSLNYIGNQGPVTISWDPATGLDDATIANPTATVGLMDQEYIVTITDSVGTVIMDTVTVISVAMTVDAGSDVTTLCGASTSVTAVATIGNLAGVATTYSWSNGDQGNLSTTAGGSYTVTATNTAGCTATDVLVVTVTGENTADFTVASGPICKAVNKEFTNASSKTTGWDFTWKLDGANDKFGNSANYAILTDGTHTITLIADSSTCSYEETKNITVEICGDPDAINDLNLKGLSISPNPATDMFNVSFEMNNNNSVEVSLVAIDGKVLNTKSFVNTTSVNASFNAATLSTGIYIVKITTNEGVTTRNVVVSK